jgi:hypothetical protein
MNASLTGHRQAVVTVLVDGEVQVEYQRDKPLAEPQRSYLDRMDEQMQTGFRLGGIAVARPDKLQRAQFVAIQVIEALQAGNDAMIAAGCAYLASRLPDLTQVIARLTDGGFAAELVFNQPYVKEVAVDFTPHRPS